MASGTFNIGSFRIADRTVDFAANDIEIILVKDTYAFNPDDTNTVYAAAEISGITGYTGGFGGAGRKLLGSKTITNDTTNNRTVFDATDPTAWTLGAGDTIGGAIIGKKGAADDTTAIPLWFLDGTNTPTNGGTFDLDFHPNGMAYTQQ